MGRRRSKARKKQRPKPQRPVPKVPQCGSCGEDVSGLGRYCSACGCAIAGDVHVEYARYLETIQRMGIAMGLTSSSALAASGAAPPKHPDSTHSSAALTTPADPHRHSSSELLGQYDGASGVFLAAEASQQETHTPAPPSGAPDGSGSPSRRARARRQVVVPPRPPAPYQPATGPQLDSTPLAATKVVNTAPLNRLSAPLRTSHKKFGEVSWFDPYHKRNVRMVGREKHKGVQIVSDNPKTTEHLTEVHYYPASMTLAAEARNHHLPKDDDNVEDLVARIYTLLAAYDVQHNVPEPHEKTQKGWLSREPRRPQMGREAAEKLVKRLHDESLQAMQRVAHELESKYPFKPPKVTPPVSLKDVTSRLYYGPVEKKKDRERKVDEHFAEPLAPKAVLDPDSLMSSTARLYAEGMVHQKERQRDLEERYVPSPQRVTRTAEDQKGVTDRLFSGDQEKRDAKLEDLRRQYNPIRETRKLTREQQEAAVQRLAAGER